jgi:SAM-dependent methyltransferase
MHFFSKIIRKAVAISLRQIPGNLIELLIQILVRSHLKKTSPAEGLRFLFRLDAFLYPLQGKSAVQYGGGIHTKHRHISYHKFFVNRVKKHEKVLDIGCGNGAVAYSVADGSGANVVGLDLSERNVAEARKRYSHPLVEFRIGDALRQLPQERFDVIILSNVLEHIADRHRFLERIQQCVTPKRFLIRVPLFEREWRVPLKKELGVEWRLDPTHETEYTLETFAEEIHAAGLNICHSETRWGELWAEAVNAN